MVPIHVPSAVLFIVLRAEEVISACRDIVVAVSVLYGWDTEDTSLMLSVGRQDSDTIDDGTVPFIIHFLRNRLESKKPGLRYGWRRVAKESRVG